MKYIVQYAAMLGAAATVAATLSGCGTTAHSNNHQTAVATSQSSQTQKTGFPVTLTDDAGKKVTVSALPKHIVSTTEGTDEILVSLVPKSRISLVTNLSSDPTYSDVVNQVKGIPQMSQVDAEKVLSVQPDLVLMASYVNAGVISQVRNAGVPVYEFNDFTSVDSIEHNIRVVGQLVGASAKADKLVQNMNENMQKIEQAVKGQKKPKVLDYSSYGYAEGRNTTFNDVITVAGGINAAASLNGTQKISDEEIVKMNPDVIIDSEEDQAFLKKLASDKALQSVSAIRNHRLYAVPDADLSSVSQYVVKGMVDVAKDIHPNVKLPDIQVMK
ncbi:ABC transporter substrate-binding protein [Alicyclobacillus suci]|uniref:ABC transporter substrate-binding protein n=1 Tax=Alicyclobacillus suci TaxID=2816080 RepID=UPI001F463821|nr:ABC transporter substrate-binding protein [Alicyclobacillus suci]